MRIVYEKYTVYIDADYVIKKANELSFDDFTDFLLEELEDTFAVEELDNIEYTGQTDSEIIGSLTEAFIDRFKNDYILTIESASIYESASEDGDCGWLCGFVKGFTSFDGDTSEILQTYNMLKTLEYDNYVC